ncbi:hypothetical protein F5B18DRAFT_663235 [Nemania serpens]|nr:hypothetical protein F5B18DRAFT_663235 [Nemania serpens]
MSDMSSLPRASRRTVENFIHRSEFWLRVPGNDRDYFWEMDNPDGPYSYTASYVVQFTKANCLATTAASNDKLLEEFKRKLQTDWDMNKTSAPDGMRLARLMNEYMMWIDRIFFFGLITRPMKLDGRFVAERSIIKLKFRDGLNDEGNDLHGVFAYHTGELWMNTLQSSSEFQSFDTELSIIVHELVHVYLHVLTWDQSAASYLRNIFQDNGHGVQFQELFHFILTQLFKWMPTMTSLGELATDTSENLRAALAKPSVSDTVARLVIHREVNSNFKCRT